LLISDHVESVTEVMRRKLSFLIRASPSTVSIALFAELLLLVCFSVDDWFVVADIEDKISPPRWKDWEARKARRIRWQIQVVIFVLRVYNLGGNGPCAGVRAGSLVVR